VVVKHVFCLPAFVSACFVFRCMSPRLLLTLPFVQSAIPTSANKLRYRKYVVAGHFSVMISF